MSERSKSTVFWGFVIFSLRHRTKLRTCDHFPVVVRIDGKDSRTTMQMRQSGCAWQGRRVHITIGRVLRARLEMMKNKEDGPSDCLAPWSPCTRSPIGFTRGSRESAELQRLGGSYVQYFSEKPDARLEKGLRGFRAIALLCVLSKWCTSVLVGSLHDEKEPIEWEGGTWVRREASFVSICKLC